MASKSLTLKAEKFFIWRNGYQETNLGVVEVGSNPFGYLFDLSKFRELEVTSHNLWFSCNGVTYPPYERFFYVDTDSKITKTEPIENINTGLNTRLYGFTDVFLPISSGKFSKFECSETSFISFQLQPNILYGSLEVYFNDTWHYPEMNITVNADIEPATSLSPDNTNRNPAGEINLTWIFKPPANLRIINTKIAYSINNGAEQLINVNTGLNSYTFGSNIFKNGDIIKWRVQPTIDIFDDITWSEYATFNIAITPPYPPTLIFPVNIAINGSNGIPLEWRYNSPYDITPSRFDIRWQVDNGEWVERTNTGQLSYTMDMTSRQSTIRWQVRAYGEFGDVGDWSDIATFFTIGIPATPTITNVTNSNRPLITFSSSVSFLSWELELLSGNLVIYNSGNLEFDGSFTHLLETLIENGNYLARIRIKNEFGLMSDWGQLPFNINTITPKALDLEISNNLDFCIGLYFNNTDNKDVFIYRNNKRIAKTNLNFFKDYSCDSKKRHEYFIRVIENDFAFADSEIKVGGISFVQTTIAEVNKPNEMVKLVYSMGGKPTKNITHTFEKSLTEFIGRTNPVLQVGFNEKKSISLSFYISIEEYSILEKLNKSDKVLILRDWRLGVIYGTIDGGIQYSRETNGFNISFTFTQVDFDLEVDL